jgi:hypothetical protein
MHDLLVCLFRAGENCWKYGILKKGFGICHGVYGNAYFFLSIYKLTGNPLWLKRAYLYALVKLDNEMMGVILHYWPEDRDVEGVPDEPWGL